MSTEGRLYFFACYLLFEVLVIHDEIYSPDNHDAAYNTWVNTFHPIYQRMSDWFIDECQNIGSNQSESLKPGESQAMRNFVGENLSLWSEYDEMLTAAKSAYDEFGKANQKEYEIHFHFTYLLALVKVFDKLLTEEPLLGIKYQRNYQQEKSTFEALTQYLEDDYLSKVLGHEQVRERANTFAEEWSDKWYVAVHSFAKRFQFNP